MRMRPSSGRTASWYLAACKGWGPRARCRGCTTHAGQRRAGGVAPQARSAQGKQACAPTRLRQALVRHVVRGARGKEAQQPLAAVDGVAAVGRRRRPATRVVGSACAPSAGGTEGPPMQLAKYSTQWVLQLSAPVPACCGRAAPPCTSPLPPQPSPPTPASPLAWAARPGWRPPTWSACWAAAAPAPRRAAGGAACSRGPAPASAGPGQTERHPLSPLRGRGCARQAVWHGCLAGPQGGRGSTPPPRCQLWWGWRRR